MPISDYRFDAYNNVIVPFQINNETHVIPSNAPYVVRLNEVPLKESPSSLTVEFENNTTLTEVSASPAASQFWPDFNTADQNWNTGTLQFNAADAGKIVKVSYKGTGTLAGVKSNRYPSWWLERGDGSLGDKVCKNGEVFEGVYNFNNLTIPSGVTIYINKSAVILCLGIFKNDGVINGVGRGATGTTAVARDRAASIGYFGGGGWWGSATETSAIEFGGSAPSWAISIFEKQQHLRFYGGAGLWGGNDDFPEPGGNGGAGLAIIAKHCMGTGVYTMDGGPPGGSGSTYGGGGIVYVLAETINGTKTASVAGFSLGWFKFRELGVV